MQNFKDESFISQFLSPKVMRDMKLFAIDDDDLKNYLKVSAIHNDEGYRQVRNTLSAQYNLSNLEPNIQVFNVAVKGDRSLTLRYVPHNRIPLGDSRHEVLKHLHQLWGFDVVLEQDNGELPADIIGRCPEKNRLEQATIHHKNAPFGAFCCIRIRSVVAQIARHVLTQTGPQLA